MSLSHAEATYLIARSTGVAVSQEFLKAAEMQDGEILYCMGQPEDDVVRMRTEVAVGVPNGTLRRIRPEQFLQQAHAILERLGWDEDGARLAAYGGDYDIGVDLDRLDALDFLMTGKFRGCHYGMCDDRVFDTSWRNR